MKNGSNRIIRCQDYGGRTNSQPDNPNPLKRADHHYRRVVDVLDEGVITIAGDGDIELVNPAALRILGADDVASVQRSAICARMHHGTDCENDDHIAHDHIMCTWQSLCTLFKACSSQLDNEIVHFHRLDGQQRWLSVTNRPLNPDDPRDKAMLISFADITTQHKIRERLIHAANHDVLTGLPNRAYLLDRIAAHRVCDDPEEILSAVLFIDLDNFKTINDSWGHEIGDRVLHVAAQRFRIGLRSCDIVGRLGGDEFLALVLGPTTDSDIENLTQRVQLTLAEPLEISHHTFHLHASIGVTTVTINDTRTPTEILRAADIAMYQAKIAQRTTDQYPG